MFLNKVNITTLYCRGLRVHLATLAAWECSSFLWKEILWNSVRIFVPFGMNSWWRWRPWRPPGWHPSFKSLHALGWGLSDSLHDNHSSSGSAVLMWCANWQTLVWQIEHVYTKLKVGFPLELITHPRQDNRQDKNMSSSATLGGDRHLFSRLIRPLHGRPRAPTPVRLRCLPALQLST